MGVRADHRQIRPPGRRVIVATGAICVAVAVLTACASTQAVSRTTSPPTTRLPSSTTMRPQVTGAATKPHGGRLSKPIEADVEPIQIDHASLTTQNWVAYDYTTGPDTVTASAPAGETDGNIREVFWRKGTIPTVNAQSCVTWSETAASVPGQPIQPGLAMRIASVGRYNEGLRAITLTENVVFAGTWFFNVHIWDTRNPVPMTLLHSFDASSIVGRIEKVDGKTFNTMAKPPWHLCSRVIGSLFQFKVWTRDNPKPSWDDDKRVFSVGLPPGWDHAGYSGGYIGHLHPGQSATATLSDPTPLEPR